MLLDPRRYGVIDIRVWQLLHELGAVTKNAEGVNLSSENWYEFLVIIRHYSRKLRVTARDVERTLFDAHRAYQRHQLYRVKKEKKARQNAQDPAAASMSAR